MPLPFKRFCGNCRITPVARFGLTMIFSIFLTGELVSQTWNLVKEKEGIKVYTRPTPNSSLKSFKGIADVHASLQKVYALIGNVRNTDYWDKSIKEIRVLSSFEDKSFSYYLVYSITWPLHNRDLCVDVRILHDTANGSVIISAKSNPALVPLNTDNVRIQNYWQKWIIQPLDKTHVRLILEGFADPAGSIPSWLYNMVITETPLNLIEEVRKRVE
jgi:hypothetical protein